MRVASLEAVVTALKVMDRWAKPYQAKLAEEISARRQSNPSDPEIAHALRHDGAVFIGFSNEDRSCVRTLTTARCTAELNDFAVRNGIEWKLSTHQFRRTFANYAARSQFGDLRYLRDHFKHWSMDMTLGYAMNGSAEQALFAEIQGELDILNEQTVKKWMVPSARLAGGYGQRLVEWRNGESITIFKDRSAMIRTISESTSIRSNGHAWCTADDDLCVGNGGLERTRCSYCDNAVIDLSHAPIYRGLYAHLNELLACGDIGDGGMARVRRDIERCKDVLGSLGCKVDGASI